MVIGECKAGVTNAECHAWEGEDFVREGKGRCSVKEKQGGHGMIEELTLDVVTLGDPVAFIFTNRSAFCFVKSTPQKYSCALMRALPNPVIENKRLRRANEINSNHFIFAFSKSEH